MRFRLVLGIGALLAASAALAHHSFAMFDQKQVWTWEGTVVEYNWRQPHVHIVVLVPENKKNPKIAGTWDFESSGPNIGARQGWTRASFKPGDKITVVGNPKLDGTKGASLRYAKTASGQVLYHDVERKVTPETTPAS